MLYYFCLQYIPQTSLIIKHNIIPQICVELYYVNTLYLYWEYKMHKNMTLPWRKLGLIKQQEK